MPLKAEGLVLTVDPNLIHKVDTTNPQNLFSMWAVFSRCSASVEHGARLENLAWRYLNSQRLQGQTPYRCSAATSLPKDTPQKRHMSSEQRMSEVPRLSGSVDSVADDEAIELSADVDPVDIVRPHIVRQDSCASSRRDRQASSDHLEKMVTSIIQEKEPNLTPIPPMPAPQRQEQSEEPQRPRTPDQTASMSASSTTDTASQEFTSGTPAINVVRGFAPSQPSPARITPHEPKTSAPDAIPEPQASPAPQPVQPKKQPPKFALGGSGSSGDESSPASLTVHHQPVPQPKKNVFLVGASSGEEESPSLKSAMHSARPSSLLSAQKKQASFSNQISMRTYQTPSDQSDSYIDESAIDDDDEDSEWEDSVEESGKSSMDESVTFKRVPSKANLTSQRSLISLALAGHEGRTKALSNYNSHSTPSIPQRSRTIQNMSKMATSPQDSDDNGLEMKRGPRPSPLKPINEVPRSAAQPIMTSAPAQRHQAALSPRTTRRNMLATELTESLRRQLLWERQQKSSTANAVLKRRHTSHDVANLKQYPEKAYINKAKDEPNPSSWNQYFNRDTHGGYHAQGW